MPIYGIVAIGMYVLALGAYLFSRRRTQERLTPEEALAAFHQRIEDVKHLPIKEAHRALGVRGYS